jgi:benzoyl-CoA reductase/2-hydroxyglutaryl-CoA dehydratase subunit BcrC/BadD/HgdB
MDGQRVSSKEFKILNVPKEITKEEISKAIFNVIKANTFYIKKSGIKTRDKNRATNTVFFTVNEDSCRQLLKNTWSISIRHHLYILASAAASEKDLSQRKYYRGEFYGFDSNHNMDKVIETFAMHNPKHAFRQTEKKVIVEFKTVGELYSACEHPIHFDKYQIRGTPRGADWIKRDADLKAKHVKRPQHNRPISKREMKNS